MKFKSHNSRKFLNSKEGIAAIQTNCYISDWSMDATVIISDCNRNVSLDFSVYQPKNYVEKYKKLSLLINELVSLQEFMAANIDNYTEEHKKASIKSKTTLGARKTFSELVGELDDK